MMVRVRFGRLVGVMFGAQVMGVRQMGVVGGSLVIALLVVLGGLAVMARRGSGAPETAR